MSPRFPCDVNHCNASGIIFDCRGRRLKTVPAGITSDVTELNLSENLIQNISCDAFPNMKNLTLLNLNWANKNLGMNIEEGAFKNLTKLYELRLSGNGLRRVPSNLPPSLRVLEIDNNNILVLDSKGLSGIWKVTQLFLSRNCYFWNPCGKHLTITNNSFSVMTQLLIVDLSHNNLTRVPKGLPESVHTLELSSNGIQYIFEDDFRGLPNLKILKLQGNCPRCETSPYPCVTCHNISLGIHPRAFANLRLLETLHLAGNSLTSLETSWFENLRNLKELFLSFNFLKNAITGEVDFLSYLARLEKIDLSFNFGLKSYPKTIKLSQNFSQLSSLTTLHLEGLVFKEIGPDTLSPLHALRNLSALNLGTNFIVRSNSATFSKFCHLKMIYLAENRLYPISVTATHADAGQGDQLSSGSSSPLLLRPYPKDQNYKLSHGLIKQECFDSGRVLILSSNNLFFISPEQFRGYGDIACLNLSGNGFSAALNGTEFSSLPNLTYLDLSFNKIDLAYDNAFRELKRLEVLDLSYNAHYFVAYGVTHNLNFLRNLPALRVLNMSHNSISTLTTKAMCSNSLSELQFQNNNLGTLWKERDGSYDQLFTNLTNLTILDISFNSITNILDRVYENLPRNLTILRMSHNSLTEFKWGQLKGFRQIHILDLSFNSLSYVPAILSNVSHTLRLLDLSYNHIYHLSNGFLNGTESLKTLYLSHNKLTIINQSTFSSKAENHIETLYLQGNPLHCTCDSLDFILWIEDNKNVKIPRLITEVTCETPANKKGQPIILFDINQCVNDSEAFFIWILSSTFIVATMVVTTIAHIFYWDAFYVLYFLRAKLKGYHSSSSSDSVYDVFVVYDTRDPQVSEWVLGHLRTQLEEDGDKSQPLCLEERDWPLGVPLVDNLTQSIRYSRKTLFVLTEAYVKTGVFRLAMLLAHQRLLDENVDVIVLLMLEPVLRQSHFLRLRKRLCERSVVEWPRTAAAEPWFWQNLRNVVRVDNQMMYNKTYSKYFTNE
ncbi:toll-like receptor 8 [Lampris incognitus]|uniref:toll-like receptor 8 n=1 Tax=Lampris incognitus TaxID=2546036 RepID=UPI0024B51602|nr:toll-like receptor 8 [Lampris incognitus]